jgi:hypothetical protein
MLVARASVVADHRRLALRPGFRGVQYRRNREAKKLQEKLATARMRQILISRHSLRRSGEQRGVPDSLIFTGHLRKWRTTFSYFY